MTKVEGESSMQSGKRFDVESARAKYLKDVEANIRKVLKPDFEQIGARFDKVDATLKEILAKIK